MTPQDENNLGDIKSKATQKDYKTSKRKQSDDLAASVAALREATLNALREKHLNYVKYDNFFKGNHYTVYNKSTGELVNKTRGHTTNLIKPIVRGVVNDVTKNEFKWEFSTSGSDDISEREAFLAGKLMDKMFYDVIRMIPLIRVGERGALKFGQMPFYVGWDFKANNGKGAPIVRPENPYYFLPDPECENLSEARYIIRIVKMTLDQLRINEYYDKDIVDMIKPERKIGGTPIFEEVMRVTNKIEQVKTPADLTDELGICWVTERYTKELEDDGSTRIRQVCECQGKILDDRITDNEDYPFEYLYADKDELSLFGDGWIKDLIPLNKAYNRCVTQQIEYNEIARPTMILPKGAKLTVQEIKGIRVFYVDGKLVQNIPMLSIPPLSGSIVNTQANLHSDMEDVGNFHEISRGGVPAGIKSGVAINALKMSDSNNSVELRENLEDFLERVAKKIFWNIYTYGSFLEEFQYEMEQENAQNADKPMKATGQYISEGSPLAGSLKQKIGTFADPRDILFIPANMNIRVRVETDFAYTTEAKQETLKELFSVGAIDRATLLKGYKFSNIKEIIEGAEKAEAMKVIMEQESQNKPQPPKVSVSMNYKDLPPEGQAQMAGNVGVQITPQQSMEKMMTENELQNQVGEKDIIDFIKSGMLRSQAASGGKSTV